MKAAHWAGNSVERKAHHLVVPTVALSAAYWVERLAGQLVVPMVGPMDTSKVAHLAVWLAASKVERMVALTAAR